MERLTILPASFPSSYFVPDPFDCFMAKAGRKRAVDRFSWKSIAEKTYQLYQTIVK
jgi:glycosyltransferase involved in cell wall biosynthesis